MGKIIFNTTYHVETSVGEAWKLFMQTKFFPKLSESELFSPPRICRILSDNDSSIDSYAVQFTASQREDIESWMSKHGNLIHVYLRKTFGDKVLFFSTFMEEL